MGALAHFNTSVNPSDNTSVNPTDNTSDSNSKEEYSPTKKRSNKSPNKKAKKKKKADPNDAEVVKMIKVGKSIKGIQFKNGYLVNTKYSKHMEGTSPDFTLFVDSDNQTIIYSLLFLELKNAKNIGETSEIGQIIKYNENAQPFKSKFVTILTNLNQFLVLESRRKGEIIF